MFLTLMLITAAADPTTPDYQKIAETTEWKWKDATATVMHAACVSNSDYDIRLDIRARKYDVKITFSKDDKDAFTYIGHDHSVFRIAGDTLYYAEFHPSSSGATMVAVDLKTGKKLWKTNLKGIGLVQHFGYQNFLNMEIQGDAITVFGKESFGNYVEILDTKTGKTVGNYVFPKKDQPQK